MSTLPIILIALSNILVVVWLMLLNIQHNNSARVQANILALHLDRIIRLEKKS